MSKAGHLSDRMNSVLPGRVGSPVTALAPPVFSREIGSCVPVAAAAPLTERDSSG